MPKENGKETTDEKIIDLKGYNKLLSKSLHVDMKRTKDWKLETIKIKDDEKLTKSDANKAVEIAKSASNFIEHGGWQNFDFGKYLTPRKVTLELKGVIETLAKKLEALEEEDQKLKFYASQKIIKDDSGVYAGNGKCYIQFVNVGMGDCTLVTTPKGRRIMIDCGSSCKRDVIFDAYDPATKDARDVSAVDLLRNTVESKTFSKDKDNIDLLLLTHPDRDHNNLLQDILPEVKITQIGAVYFGGAESITAYVEANYLATVGCSSPTSLRKVTLNEPKNFGGADNNSYVDRKINDVKLTASTGKADTFLNEFVETRDVMDPLTDSGAIVLYYEQGEKSSAPEFKISILAANVTCVWKNQAPVTNDENIKTPGELKLPGTATNQRSLVILVEAFGESVLICGDATAVTEAFLVKRFSGRLANVTHLRMGHHGSPTSSSKSFLDAMPKLKYAVVSTGGRYTELHGLPKYEILALYQTMFESAETAKDHTIWSYYKNSAAAQNEWFKDIKTELYATGSNGSVSFAFET